MDTINDRFKILRKACNKSQEEFGKILGLSKSGVSDIENGRRNVTDQHLIMLSNWQEKPININWLKTGKGEAFEQLTDQQKIMKYTAVLLKDTDSLVANAIKNFIVTYEQLDDASKRVLENVTLKYLGNMKKGQ